MKEEIINFSEFFKNREKLSTFNKEEIKKDFFIEEDPIVEEKEEVSNEKEEVLEKQSLIKENFVEETPIVEEEVVEEEDEKVIEEPSHKPQSTIESNAYKVYKDKSETFSCEIEVEGAKIKDTQVRLIMETNEWSLIFNGDIDSYGKVTIPIKKLSLFEEGTVGAIRMEVIAEGSVFVPWEDEFEVRLSKKVAVKFNNSKTQRPETNSSVRVNFRR